MFSSSLSSPARPDRRALWLLVALAALAWVALVWRFDWLCDDAFISFRYARNLALGRGLVFNPGEDPPVEGYTNFLWCLWLAPFERAGIDVALAARATSIACGAVLLVLFARHARSLFGRDSWSAPLALLFVATLPPIAVWSTSGLETMPFTLAVFASYERLLGDRARPRGVQAGLAGLAACLLRADGAASIATLLACGLALAVLERSRAVARATLIATVLVVAGVAAHLAWRVGYYGELVPNTARVKVELGLVTYQRGLAYLGTFLVTFPSVPIALGLWLATLARERSRAELAPAVLVALNFAYVVAVGGDFMAMGRFLVPALPFAGLLFAFALQRLGRLGRGSALPIAIALCSCVLSVLPAFGVHVAPRALRERLAFRWSADRYRHELEQWRMMREQAREWTLLGRALARNTKPGESLILGTIGAVGYHSDLWIHDPFGLVNREAFAEVDPAARRSPGHQRRVPRATFEARGATYLEAQLVPADAPYLEMPRVLFEERDQLETRWLEVDGVRGIPPGWRLRLSRRIP